MLCPGDLSLYSVVRDRDPVILALANTCIVLNVGGGPTDDKPTVRLAPPADPAVASGFLNLQVRDIATAYRDWSARGATFLTEPKDHGPRSAPTSAIRTVTSSR